jgi:hypothetical protein
MEETNELHYHLSSLCVFTLTHSGPDQQLSQVHCKTQCGNCPRICTQTKEKVSSYSQLQTSDRVEEHGAQLGPQGCTWVEGRAGSSNRVRKWGAALLPSWEAERV